eukprot:98654-Rhodomonas_salina.1
MLLALLVLTWDMLLARCCAMCGTAIGFAAKRYGLLAQCYAVCGTDLGYAATRSAVLSSAMLCDLWYSPKLCCYAKCGYAATSSAVLSEAMLLRDLGTLLGYATKRSAVLSWAMVLRDVRLCCYAKCGTDLGYAASNVLGKFGTERGYGATRQHARAAQAAPQPPTGARQHQMPKPFPLVQTVPATPANAFDFASRDLPPLASPIRLCH